jgi:hypothetical protein
VRLGEPAEAEQRLAARRIVPSAVPAREVVDDRGADAAGLRRKRVDGGGRAAESLPLERRQPIGHEGGVDAGVPAFRMVLLLEPAAVAEERVLEVGTPRVDLPTPLVDRAGDAERLGVGAGPQWAALLEDPQGTVQTASSRQLEVLVGAQRVLLA